MRRKRRREGGASRFWRRSWSSSRAWKFASAIRAAELEESVVSGYEVSPTGHQFISLREYEDEYIREVLAATGNNKTQAARMLGIHPTSLLRRRKKLTTD